jgi:hypothetical protein
MRTFRAGLFVVIGALAGAAHAWPTSLITIPIADILGHREIYTYSGLTGTERHISRTLESTNSMAVGLFDRIEIGYDDDFNGVTSGHVKVLLFDDGRSGLSAGYVGIIEREKSPFVVGRINLSEKARFHAGWYHDGISRAMFGFDLALNDDWTLMADSISGRDSMTCVGFNGPLFGASGIDVTVSGGIPHTRANGYTYTVYIGYSARF